MNPDPERTRPANVAADVAAEIADRLAVIQERVAAACHRAGRGESEVTIVGATKTMPPERLIAAHQAGLRVFGENRVQEAETKVPALAHLDPAPEWRLIGHLQTNKVRAALDLFAIIESVDSLRLATAIAQRTTRSVPVLLEVNVAGEASKHGFRIAETGLPEGSENLREAYRQIRDLPHLDVRGLMTVAPLVPIPEAVRPVFRTLARLRNELSLPVLSMGMTDDYPVAIEEGATHIRLGRALFGERR